MSILINMEMPTDHPLWIIVHSDGTVEANEVSASRPVGWQTLRNAAVPVPPHGRLIDADALMHEFEKAQRTMEQHGQEYSCSFMSSSQELSTEWYCVEDMLENAPTVIEAEEGEE